tara:strand:- start:1500 stop:2798 length:1299 start_codon:yes stop_codon:yes gene_type:complete
VKHCNEGLANCLRQVALLVLFGIRVIGAESEVPGGATDSVPPVEKSLSAAVKDGATMLHVCAVRNWFHDVGLLLEHGADVDARTQNGFTPLHWAASADALTAARILIAAGADIDARAKGGITPLHWAADNNATNIVKLLLACGADVTSTTRKGLRPLHWAIMKNAEASAIAIADAELVEEGFEADPSRGIVESDTIAPTQKPVVIEHWEPFSVPLGRSVDLPFVWVDAMRMWVGKCEVSNEQYRRFQLNHDSGTYGGYTLNHDKQPAARLSWVEARSFCIWLNHICSNSLPNKFEFRLPTEEEWETFARCGDERVYPWGADFPPAYGNYSDEAARSTFSNWQGVPGYRDGYAASSEVRMSGKNDWGLFGVGGNVWEWCADWYGDERRYRVRRGGGWSFDGQRALRVDYRGFDRPADRYATVGFRLVAGPVRP